MAHLGNLGLDEALRRESKMSSSLNEKEKAEILKKARNAIILSLSDQILKKVVKEKSTAEMWMKLEQLYMTKALPNRIYLKQRFYGFKIDETKTIDENINEFTKLVDDLENLEFEVDEEDQTIFFLNSLPKQYDQLRDTLKYGKKSLSFDEVVSAAYSKELDLKANGKQFKPNGEGLNVRGKPGKRDFNNNKDRHKSRSKSRTKKTCWTCHKEGHIKKYCPQRKKGNGKFEDSDQGDAASVSDGYDSAEVLAVTCDDPKDEWILDSGCTFHMTPRRDWFVEYKEINGRKVLMGNNVACNIVGIGSVRIKM